MIPSRLSGFTLSAQEQTLVDLAQWLARAQQYGAAHPSCVVHCEKMHVALTRALQQMSPIEYGILKDDVTIGGVAAMHPVVKTRIAPYLHERGVLVMRVMGGVTQAELSAFVEALTWSSGKIFDAGGLMRLLVERGVARIQIEELAHEVTDEERAEHRRRKQLRRFFAEMLEHLLARRQLADFNLGDQLTELLAYPEVASTILEEESRGAVAEGVAGLALMVLQEEKKTGQELSPKLRRVLLLLTPDARDKVVVGFPPLVGEFRVALATIVDGYDDEDLARFVFPAVRAHVADLDHVLYALSVLVPRDLRRMSLLRRVALRLYDLPDDEARTILATLAATPEEFDSYRAERDCLSAAAKRAIFAREPVAAAADPASLPPVDPSRAAPTYGGLRTSAEIVRMCAAAPGFERFCERLPLAAQSFAEDGNFEALIGLVRGLAHVPPEQAPAATRAMQRVAQSSAMPQALSVIEAACTTLEGRELEELVGVVRALAVHAPSLVCDRLEQSENRKMRRILLDALPLAGPALLPLVRGRLRSSSWFVVRNFVALLPRAGATAAELEIVARHPNEKVRLEIARALRAMPLDEAVLDLVAMYLTDASQDVRQAVRGVLRGDLLGPRAIAALAALATNENEPEDLRRVAVQALGRSPSDAAAEALFEVMQPRGLLESSATTSLRDAAASALRSSRAPAAPRLFAAGLASNVWRVRKACERAGKSE